MKNILKDKSKINLSIDIIMLLLMMPIAGIGFLMKYVLLAGIQRNEVYGRNVDLEFIGLTRHQWGSIHLALSIAFLVLLVLHVILHWNMIVCIFRRMISNLVVRVVLATIILVFSLLFLSFFLMVKPEIIEKESLHLNRNARYNSSMDALPGQRDTMHHNKKGRGYSHEKHNTDVEYEVKGYQTLQFIAEKYDVPAQEIANDLNIPETLVGIRLGLLKKQYSFTMEDVRKSISDYKKR